MRTSPGLMEYRQQLRRHISPTNIIGAYNRVTFTKFVAPRAAIGCPPVITI